MIAAAALLLAPVAWVLGERRAMARAYAIAVAAQEEALREQVEAEQSMRAGEAALRRENLFLKKQVEVLHGQLELLKAVQGR